MTNEMLPSQEPHTVTFEDLHELAKQVSGRVAKLTRMEIYVSDNGKLNERMKKPPTEDFYTTLEARMRRIQQSHNQIRHRLTERFPKINAETWNNMPIGKALLQLSKQLIDFVEAMRARQPYDPVELMVTFGHIEKLLIPATKDSLGRSDEKVLGDLNTWAQEYLEDFKKHAEISIIARMVQTICLGAESAHPAIRNMVRGQNFLDLYPTIKTFFEE